MPDKNPQDSPASPDRTAKAHPGARRAGVKYVLRLYITGVSPVSSRAIVNIRRICEEYLEGCYELEVVDVSQNPALAAGEQIIAVPTLIKKLPLPLRRFIGDMSRTDRLILGLDLRQRQKEASK